MHIACDINGILKSQTSDDPIKESIDSIKTLARKHKITFISKCVNSHMTYDWLKKYDLDKYEMYFCENEADKVTIAQKRNVEVIIDDKLGILANFPENIKKIWLDTKQINSTKKYQTGIYESVDLVHSWFEIVELL